LQELFKYFWLIVITAGALSLVRSKVKAQSHINANHTLRRGYNELILARFSLVLIPMLIIGYGCMTQQTTNFLDFFYPRKMNAVVLALHAALIIQCLLVYYWVFIKDGAGYMRKYPAIFSSNLASNKTVGQASARKIKRVFKIQLIVFILFLALLWIATLPVIHF